jgi:glycosyltransferase involved in cell wall biosynthesis
LVEKKGGAHLIRAMARVQAQCPDARLVVIGDGVQRADLERQASGELRQCSFLGACSRDVVREWMGRVRVLAVPSITAATGEAEGLPTVVVEAQSMGLPVSAFRSAGIAEIIHDGDNGFLAEERDDETLAASLRTLLEDDATWGRMSEAARTCVLEDFDLKTQTRKLEALYDEAIRGRDAGDYVASPDRRL